ncbi:proteasome component region PCI domain-containing protein [Heterostelium album PN500]|uniref:Eukaryotic translation initiation factor 3 subunit L n=1 Tax=Heterostelium pallidum (strain ATCC 26659 / Pp 5 / PN500) TaxID=670386 RepID=D3BGB9_HETP5|nr:proteasome component region PCI domain-containing protein [Heterostelium album PN500]EFA79519.1 proteasome component region PCI domain-containing protein [Heterostelium album PN500]|eukprot:XP_020431640.1 proteasome component region PCI domain-containing protein [Heterostelium album PN500]
MESSSAPVAEQQQQQQQQQGGRPQHQRKNNNNQQRQGGQQRNNQQGGNNNRQAGGGKNRNQNNHQQGGQQQDGQQQQQQQGGQGQQQGGKHRKPPANVESFPISLNPQQLQQLHQYQQAQQAQQQGSNQFLNFLPPATVLYTPVVNYMITFLNNFRSQSHQDILLSYDNFFRSCEIYYPNCALPTVEVFLALLGDRIDENNFTDKFFILLYKEIYYRYYYARVSQPNIHVCVESWQNYALIFNTLLDAQTPTEVEIDLPNAWVWDIVDEFVYQYHTFAKAKLKKSDVEFLSENPDIWDTTSVIQYLYFLIRKSQIFNSPASGTESSLDDFCSHPVYKMLGYYSIISLVRVQCLLGDYTLALKTLELIDMGKRAMYTFVTACHITLYYYLAYAYLMSRRYNEANKALNTILISMASKSKAQNFQADHNEKKIDKMYALLAICQALYPSKIDENVNNLLKEKFGEKLLRMQKGEIAVYEELFTFASPRCVGPVSPYISGLNQTVFDPPRLQLSLFIEEVKQQSLLTTIRSYITLYSSISIQKLATLLQMDPEDLRVKLTCYKHKLINVLGKGDNKWNNQMDIDFTIDQDMIHIDNRFHAKETDSFINSILKFEGSLKTIF